MFRNHPIGILLLAIFMGPLSMIAFCDGDNDPVSDLTLKAQFEKKLGRLKDSDQTASTDRISSQLNEQKKIKRALPKGPSIPLTTASVYKNRKDGVLCLGNIYKCERCSNWHGNISGGFVITKDGLAVTNYHVMKSDKADAFGAMNIDGRLYTIKEVVASSEKDDLAIVQLQGTDFSPLPIAAAAPVGSNVTVISHPEGRFYTVSQGIISRYYKKRGGKEKGASRLAITADYAKGSSGAPVFDENGSVVGVVTSTNSIYYNKKEGVERNLQMVIKSCIPSSAILKLLGSVEPE